MTMNLRCPISGLSYTASSGYGHGIATHPFLLSSNRTSLTAQLQDYLTGDLTSDNANSDESYLYCLAWLPILGVTFSATVDKESAHPFLLANLERMVTIIGKLDNHVRSAFPSFIVTEADRDLSSLPNWLNAIQDCIADISRSRAEFTKDRKLSTIEESLERIIHSVQTKDIPRAAKIIANWAAVAGDFPLGIINDPHANKTNIRDYWCNIIVNSFKEDNMMLLEMRVSVADMDELIEHCEYNIPHGSSYAHILMTKIRAAKEIIQEFTGRPFYKQLGTEAQRIAKPKRSDFRDNMSYIRALAKHNAEVVQSVGEIEL